MGSRAHPAGWVYIVVHQVRFFHYCNIPAIPNIFGTKKLRRGFFVALALWSRRGLAGRLPSLRLGVHAYERADGGQHVFEQGQDVAAGLLV